MIGLDFDNNTPIFNHNVIEFGLQSPSSEAYGTLCYGTGLDWTKPRAEDDHKTHKALKPHHIFPNTPDAVAFSNSKNEFDDGFNFDLDIDQTEGNHDHSQPRGEVIFPELPRLQRGPPETHLRNGIVNARRLLATGEPDGEKAFFVADLSAVYKQHQRWLACLPEIQPYYAVKCNPDPYVIRLLASLGAGFDCASNGEIKQVLSIGDGTINPSRIIFANPCKAVSFIRAAAKAGVDMMTFDNADELHKIAKAHPRAKLVVRILTDDSKSLCAFGIKFGTTLSSVPSLLAKAKELELDVVGVSFHVGSGCYDPSVYRDAIWRAKAVFDMGREAGYKFTLLDVGGGFDDGLFERAAEVLRGAIEEYFPEEMRKEGVKVIAEPGRFYVATAFRLAVNVIARRAPLGGGAGIAEKVEKEDQDRPEVMYYVNDGVYGAFNCILFDHQTPQPQVLTLKGSFYTPPSQTIDDDHSTPHHTQQLASIWGPTCDSIDCVSKGTMLPCGIQVGDWLGFENMGAYTLCAASQFNGFDVSKVIYTVGAGEKGEAVRRLLVRFRSSAARGREG